LATVIVTAALASPAGGQLGEEDELLLPVTISERDVEMRAPNVWQWQEEDGTPMLLFTGGFRLDMGQRRLSANDAVVWIKTGVTDADGREFRELTVYLSENAEVQEASGATIVDHVLLVSNLRTYGRIVKYHDRHSPEALKESPLYQQALRERARIEAGEPTTRPEMPVGVVRPGEAARPKVERPTRVVRYHLPNVEPAKTPDGQQVFVAIGRVYFSQSGGPDAPVLEIQADNAVVFPTAGTAETFFRAEGETSGQVSPPTEESPPDQQQRVPPIVPGAPDSERLGVQAVYLEGDVVLSFGNRFVRASRLYYDFERQQALILDAVFRAEIPERGIPLYVRAAEIRQLSAREFTASKALVSTSEFYTPHYHLGAERVYLRDRTARDADGRPSGRIAGTYELRHTTLNVEGLPIGYWPYSRGDVETSETLIRRVRTGYSDDFGAEFESAWYLLNLLGFEPPPGFDSTLRLDYFSKRGPGIGADSDYLREDYYGVFRSYYIHDDGEDNLGPLRDNIPDTSERGRVLWRHRHFLPSDWELTFEIAYVSDPGFLEEYEKSEFFEGKEQETAIYLKRARGVEAISLLANWRLLDFVTQTEHLPDLTYRRIGDTFASPFVLYHESRVGAVRYQPDDRRFFDRKRFDNTSATNVVFRTDIREEAELPLKLGPLNVVPFATLRGSFWSDAGTIERQDRLWRGLGVYGVRGGMTFSRVFDEIESELFDIHRIRHIVNPHFAAWWAHSNARSTLITPFDEGIETIDDFYGATFGVRQTWQTKRGGEERQRTVDLLTFNLEAGFFGGRVQSWEQSNGYANPLRPEDSRTRNYVAGDLIYRLSDTTSLLYDFNLDLDDWSFDRHNVALAVERLPRLAYIFGLRHAGDIDMNLLGGGFNYKLTEKHIVTSRTWFDIDSGELGEFAVGYVRKLPRWYFAVNFEWDEVFDDFTVSVSLWPEGIPEWTLGSRRFTGLETTTGIKP